ncbi:hypothetical protein PENTCL1PPCAC_10234, partial [Pristionchus entomophagus]
PVKLLLDLSSLLTSLHIYQCKVEGVGHHLPCLLGLVNVDWTPIIIEMLSNKLDKLHLENRYHRGYLSTDGSDLLREELPLLDKRIWFEATCHNYEKGLQYTMNEHIVRGGNIN